MIKKVLVLSSLAVVTLLNADYVLEYKMDDETQTFMYKNDSALKMITTDSSAMYKIGDKTYLVRGKTVVDMADMRKIADSFGYDSSVYQEEVSSLKPQIKKSSKRVNIAGIKGEEWIVSGTEDGEHFEEKVIVTKDKRVVTAVRAMTNMFSSMTDGSADTFELEKGYVLIQSDGMELKSFKEMKIDKSEYKLPKGYKKQDIPTRDSINAVVEKATNDYKARESQREEPKTQKEKDEEVDKAVNLLKSFF